MKDFLVSFQVNFRAPLI